MLRAPRKFSVCGEWGAEKGCCKTMQIYAFFNFVVRALLIKTEATCPIPKTAWRIRDMTEGALLQCALLLPIALVWVGVAFWTSCGRDAHQPGAPGYRFRYD